MQQGIDTLTYLAKKRETGEHIARQMAMYFVSHNPSPSLVKAIADSFNRNKEGNLRETARALLLHDEAWTTRLGRIQQPYVWFISMLRALNLPLDRMDVIYAETPDKGNILSHNYQTGIFEKYITMAGQMPWTWHTPDGFPHEDAFWRNGNALRIRVNVAYQFLRDLQGQNIPSD